MTATDTTWLPCNGCSVACHETELCGCDDDPMCGRCHRDHHLDDRRAA